MTDFIDMAIKSGKQIKDRVENLIRNGSDTKEVCTMDEFIAATANISKSGWQGPPPFLILNVIDYCRDCDRRMLQIIDTHRGMDSVILSSRCDECSKKSNHDMN